jgi:hypothetical protein
MGTGVLPAQRHRALLSDLIDTRRSNAVQRTRPSYRRRNAWDARAGDILIGSHRQQVAASRSPGGRLRRGEGQDTLNIRLNTRCHHVPVRPDVRLQRVLQYYKNIENAHYKFIPMVHRTHADGSVSHVTGIVNITAED